MIFTKFLFTEIVNEIKLKSHNAQNHLHFNITTDSSTVSIYRISSYLHIVLIKRVSRLKKRFEQPASLAVKY